MGFFFKALSAVSRINLPIADNGKSSPSDWQLVLARALVAVIYAAAAALILWLMPENRLVAALLATAATIALRNYLSLPSERSGLIEVSLHLTPETTHQVEQAAYQHAIFNLVLVARPICIFLLLLNCNFLWLIAAAALSYAVAIASVKDNAPGEWVSAVAVTLAVGAISSKVCSTLSGMFFISIIGCIICWLLSFAIARVNFNDRFNSTLYIAEFSALLLGMVGQAF